MKALVTPSDAPLVDGQIMAGGGHPALVRTSARRRRLGLTVERDGAVVLHAPADCDHGRAADFLAHNRRWIAERLAERARTAPQHPVKRLADGEVFRYLGVAYRLRLVAAPAAPVRLVGGRLLLDRGAAADGRAGVRALRTWYTRVGEAWAGRRLQPWAARMDLTEPELRVRELGHRWGDYRPPQEPGRPGIVSLHWAVLQLPMQLVDYVIAHELAHAMIPGHRSDFWSLLGRAMPEYGERRAELDELGRWIWRGDVSSD
ncbi:M48 family metallopeptidase [Kitasatospora purpeofusca]|uniref:M48 family metallopeptidase n=1 Tax=Kitasatospora purpeofusca TaxID=67352 RepID=UPI0036EF8114